MVEVERKHWSNKVLSWNNLEVVSNLNRYKWEKSNEVKESHLLNEEEVSKLFCVVSSEVES